MKKIITSKIVGVMAQDLVFWNWWRSKKINVPFFENKMLEIVYVTEESDKTKKFISDADNALSFFLSMNSSYKLLVSNIILAHYDDYITQNKILKEIFCKAKNQVWDLVTPNYIYFERDVSSENKIIITITCNCLWDIDFRLQLIIEYNEKYTKISTQHESDVFNKLSFKTNYA